MLPKSARLPYYLSRSVMQKGKRLAGKYFDVFYVPVETSSQWLIITPKRLVAKAHDRNKIRRLVREKIKHVMPLLKSQIQAVIKYKQTGSVSLQEQINTLGAQLASVC